MLFLGSLVEIQDAWCTLPFVTIDCCFLILTPLDVLRSYEIQLSWTVTPLSTSLCPNVWRRTVAIRLYISSYRANWKVPMYGRAYVSQTFQKTPVPVDLSIIICKNDIFSLPQKLSTIPNDIIKASILYASNMSRWVTLLWLVAIDSRNAILKKH